MFLLSLRTGLRMLRVTAEFQQSDSRAKKLSSYTSIRGLRILSLRTKMYDICAGDNAVEGMRSLVCYFDPRSPLAHRPTVRGLCFRAYLLHHLMYTSAGTDVLVQVDSCQAIRMPAISIRTYWHPQRSATRKDPCHICIIFLSKHIQSIQIMLTCDPDSVS